MAPTKRISPNAIGALKQALTAAFWRKKDLLDWLRSAVDDQQTLNGIDWLGPDQIKRDSIEVFVNRLSSRQDVHGEQLLRLGIAVAMEQERTLSRSDPFAVSRGERTIPRDIAVVTRSPSTAAAGRRRRPVRSSRTHSLR
jgi:hypothetical protein